MDPWPPKAGGGGGRAAQAKSKVVTSQHGGELHRLGRRPTRRAGSRATHIRCRRGATRAAVRDTCCFAFTAGARIVATSLR